MFHSHVGIVGYESSENNALLYANKTFSTFYMEQSSLKQLQTALKLDWIETEEELIVPLLNFMLMIGALQDSK